MTVMEHPQSCTVLYKILTPAERDAMIAMGEGWRGTELDLKDGFIHLSTSKQLPGTLERFFSNSSQVGDQLYILALPRSPAIEAKLRFDAALDTTFGHIYGSLDPATDFSNTTPMKRDEASGRFPLGELQF